MARSRSQTAVRLIAGDKLFPDGKPFPVGGKRLVGLALRQQHVADLVIGDGKVALVLGIAWIVVGEGLRDREALLKGRKRLIEFTLSHQHTAHPSHS